MDFTLSADDFSTTTFSRPTWAEIDLDALRSNARALSGLAGAKLIAVIKADAYGHGSVQAARVLAAEDAVQILAVASVDEGLQLRAAGIQAPILLLSAILPCEAAAAVRAGLMPTVFTMETALAVSEAAGQQNQRAAIHIKLDTGMTRLGVWHEEAENLLRGVLSLPHLRIEGLYTHFACADEDEEIITSSQLKTFEDALAKCRAVFEKYSADFSDVALHAANSAAAVRLTGARFDLVRPGLALYGVSPLSLQHKAWPALQPVMTLRARVTNVREIPAGAAVSYGATWRAAQPSCIATLPIGYADGYSRRLSNCAEVLVRGQRCGVVGRVTMDQILVDCSQLNPKVQIGEAAVLWGRDLPVEEVAGWADTIPYELLCHVHKRVPRVYQNNGA